MPRRTVGGALGELAARGEVGLVRCRQCDFELVEPRPDDLALAGFYEAQDYTAHEPVDDAAAVRRAEHQLAQVLQRRPCRDPLRGGIVIHSAA